MSNVNDLLTGADGVAEARIFVFNLTSGSVSAAYGTVIVLAVAFAIAAIGALLYYLGRARWPELFRLVVGAGGRGAFLGGASRILEGPRGPKMVIVLHMYGA